jgi:hypothetical protein
MVSDVFDELSAPSARTHSLGRTTSCRSRRRSKRPRGSGRRRRRSRSRSAAEADRTKSGGGDVSWSSESGAGQKERRAHRDLMVRIVLPAVKVKVDLLLVLALELQIAAQGLEDEARAPWPAHRVVRLDALEPKVDDGAGPVGVALVDRDEDEVLLEDVDLRKDAKQSQHTAEGLPQRALTSTFFVQRLRRPLT